MHHRSSIAGLALACLAVCDATTAVEDDHRQVAGMAAVDLAAGVGDPPHGDLVPARTRQRRAAPRTRRLTTRRWRADCG